jgi:IS30 family transposase
LTISFSNGAFVSRTYRFVTYRPEKVKKAMLQRQDIFRFRSLSGTKRLGESAVVLSLLFKNCDLQLYFYRSANTARSVAEIFNVLRSKLTDSEFSKLFPVILTDRGFEFIDPTTIEINRETGEAQSRVFYCDPMNSNQKAKANGIMSFSVAF